MKSLRDFLDLLDKDGELAHIKKKVQRNWEISAVIRQVLGFPSAKRPALMFENVDGFSMPVVVGLFTNRRRYAKALGIKEADIGACWEKAFRQPLAYDMAKHGPCQENILSGSDAG